MGQAWLVERWEVIADAGQVADATRDLFLRGMDRWCTLEKTLRELYHYQGCALGRDIACDPEAPVICDACAEC